jgi:hypothetical protein
MMKNRLYIANTILIISLFCSQTVHAAVIQTAFYNNHNYHLLSINDWFDSEAEAIALGGHLITINNAAENEFVYNTFKNTVINLGGNGLWTGLNDIATEGNWVWASGEAVTYTHWAADQPVIDSENTEDMAAIGLGSWNGYWHDILTPPASWDAIYGVAEVVVPLPAAIWLFGFGVISLIGFGKLQSTRLNQTI